MSGSLNKVLLIGKLGRDPEVRHTPSGQPLANFSIATDESYTGKDGQKVEKTEWHKIVVWGKQAEFCGNYLSKGRLVYIEGKIETRKYTDKDGVEKYSTEIKADRVVGLDSRQSEGVFAPTTQYQNRQPQGGTQSAPPAPSGREDMKSVDPCPF